MPEQAGEGGRKWTRWAMPAERWRRLIRLGRWSIVLVEESRLDALRREAQKYADGLTSEHLRALADQHPLNPANQRDRRG